MLPSRLTLLLIFYHCNRLNITYITKDKEEFTFQVSAEDNLLDIAQANDLEMEGMVFPSSPSASFPSSDFTDFSHHSPLDVILHSLILCKNMKNTNILFVFDFLHRRLWRFMCLLDMSHHYRGSGHV